MRAPDLIVIGAMKSGTTTMYADLAQHPRARLSHKEAGGLLTMSRQRYLRQWEAAPDDDALVDIAATYSMAPHLPGAADAAAEIAPRAKIVYLVRDPIARCLSHYFHDLSAGTVPSAIDDALRTDPRFIDYSSYRHQLALWQRHFTDDRIRVIKFEDYVERRAVVIGDLLGWLGLPPPPPTALFTEIHNAGDGKRSARGVVRAVVHSRWYRQRLRPHLPGAARARLADRLLGTAPDRPPPPRRDTLEWLADVLTPETLWLRHWAGIDWDLSATIESLSAGEDRG